MARITLRTLLALGGAAVLALWWSHSSTGLTGTPSLAITTFAELAGLVASYLVCVQVLLVARVPWFERAVGLDRLVSWHRTVGTTVTLLVLTHVCFMVLGGMLADGRSPWDEYLSILNGYDDIGLATIGTIIFFVVGLSSARLLRRLVPYEVWYWVHVTTYVGVFLTFFHQLSSGTDFIDNPPMRLVWILMYAATAGSVLVWRVVGPLARLARHGFTVRQVVVESPRSVSVWIEGRDLDELGVRAGNFMMFRFLSWRHAWSAHPYSISYGPRDGLLRITVAGLGDHSGSLRDLKPGTRVLVEGPHGTFTADRARAGRVLLIAGGAGIGPIAALAREFAERGADSVVLYRASEIEDMALLSELQELPGTRVVVAPGRRSELGFDPLGPDMMRRLVPDTAGREAFVCGPESMIDRVSASLRQLGVRRVHAEELSFA